MTYSLIQFTIVKVWTAFFYVEVNDPLKFQLPVPLNAGQF